MSLTWMTTWAFGWLDRVWFRAAGFHDLWIEYYRLGNIRDFLILELFKKFSIHEFSFLFSSAIIIIIIARLFNSRICPPR